MKIWAHRGCSQRYPENTLLSFGKALEIEGLEGIELDIQLTQDGEVVVIHDERVDRTTDGFGFVREYSLKELKGLHIYTGKETPFESIPTIREVLDLLLPKLEKYENGEAGGIRLNIELKTGIFPYPGIEEKIAKILNEYELKKSIVFSSFNAESLFNIHKLVPEIELGVLDTQVSNCFYKAVGLETLLKYEEFGKISLHPGGYYMDLPQSKLQNRVVRGFFGEPIFPSLLEEKLNIEALANKGVMEIFTNVPEKYI